MSPQIDRRQFLSLSSGAVLALPRAPSIANDLARQVSAEEQTSEPGASSNAHAERALPRPLETTAGTERWDYVAHPVIVNGEKPSKTTWVAHGYPAACAFDGYGAQGTKPAAVRGWWQKSVPSSASPAKCEIDYGMPVAVSAFVHYCYVPNSRDLRFFSPVPSAFKRVRISFRLGEGDDWAVMKTLADLPAECPQILTVAATAPARYWRLEILEMTFGAEMLLAYEIETYTGGIPRLVPVPEEAPAFPAAFANHIRNHKPVTGAVRGAVLATNDQHGLGLSLEHAHRMVHGEIRLFVDGAPLNVTAVGTEKWEAGPPHGRILLTRRATDMGILFDCSYEAHPNQPVNYQRVLVKVTTPSVILHYMPAYVWSQPAIDIMVNSANVQTRFAAVEAKNMMLCLFPGTDRGKLGFAQNALQNDLLLGPYPTPLLVTAIAGDWWDAYRMAVREIYDFQEQPQTVPVSEIQHGISRYLLLSENVWEPTLGTVQSWGDHDVTYHDVGYVDLFAFYGVPYSLPAYWARYVMTGDAIALERCQSIVHWLCHSGIRVQEGPARGAFFSSQRFSVGETRRFDKAGQTQAATQILASHTTGAVLWTLLYYRSGSGAHGIGHDADLDHSIDEAAEWLLKNQLPNGWWPYAIYPANGQPTEGNPSSAAIWNVWALWRLGKQTGDERYMAAAARGKQWFASEFITQHHYHGYWEDVGPGSREGYDAAIAAVAFGDMGERQLVLDAAKDAIQWIFTRQIECRQPNNSAGLVAEQTGWPPAAYCNPMMGLAAWNAWQVSKDPFWAPFAMIPKAVGWWYQPDSGAIVWTVDAIFMAPIVGPSYDGIWNDWCSAQVGSLSLRWLIREVNRRSCGKIQVDEELLRGTLLGNAVTAWTPDGGGRPVVPAHGQVNWFGFRGETQLFIAFFNHGAVGKVGMALNSRNVNGVCGAKTLPRAVHRIRDGHVTTREWNGIELATLAPDELIVLAWDYAR